MSRPDQVEDVVWNGATRDVYLAEQASLLMQKIGEHSEAINASGYGHLFGTLQSILSNEFTSALSRALEWPRPGTRFEIRSLPRLAGLLREHAGEVQVSDRTPLLDYVAAAGTPADIALSDADLTAAFAESLKSRLPTVDPADTRPISTTYRALLITRDKVVAHNEVVARSSLTVPRWSETDPLIALAKDAIVAAGAGFFGILYRNAHGVYTLSWSAERATVALERLLRTASVLPSIEEILQR